MTREEATRILDEVIPPPEHHTVDLDHLRISQAWMCIKETLTAEPVKYGRWEQVEVVHDRKDAKIQDWQQAKCSVCGRWQTTPFMYYLKLDNYCPNCGAKMDEVKNE